MSEAVKAQPKKSPAQQKKGKEVSAILSTDVRMAKNDVTKAASPKFLVQGTDKSITVRADMSGSESVPGPLQSLALGVVLTSLSRGWSAGLTQEEKDYPYNAYVYLVQSFISAAQGGTSLLTIAPLWYWYILDAIAPTTVKFKTGSVDYNWMFPVTQTYVPPPQVFSFNYSVLLGWTDTQGIDINGFYAVRPGVYDSTVADKAIQSLFTLYSEDGPMLKRTARKDTPLQLDVSSFATVYPESGSSFMTPCAPITSLQSEVFIDCPLLAKFAYYNENKFRGVTHLARSGGTPCYIIPRMIEFLSPRAIKNKVPPIFKFYNFDEFFEVLSLTVARAMEILSTSNAQQPALTCPLSPQAVQILLRQSIITRFCNHMAQDLVFDGSQAVKCAPFSVSSNGVSVTMASAPMKLPQLLAENIRACDRRLTYLKNNDHQSDIVPILGRFVEYGQLGNYVTASGVPVYTDIPGEVPINIVDLSAQTNTGLVYLDANGGYIQGLASKWNEWITTLSSSLSPLTNHAEEDGIRALSTIVNTLHITRSVEPQNNVVNPTTKTMVKRPSVASLGKKVDVVRKVGSATAPSDPNSWTLAYSPVAFTSTYAPLTPVYKYLKIMILPTAALFGDNYEGNIDLQQVNQIEPFRLNESTASDYYSSTTGMTLFERHALFAEQEVRTSLAPATEFQVELDQLTKQGRGGFFTDIAGMIAGDLLHVPGAKQIASTIGQLTGL